MLLCVGMAVLASRPAQAAIVVGLAVRSSSSRRATRTILHSQFEDVPLKLCLTGAFLLACGPPFQRARANLKKPCRGGQSVNVSPTPEGNQFPTNRRTGFLGRVLDEM